MDPAIFIALAISAVLATAAAFSIQSWAQSILPPTHTALILTMEPVFAWITSFIVLGERLGLRPAGGAVLILTGIALTELIRPPRTFPPRTKHKGKLRLEAACRRTACQDRRMFHVEHFVINLFIMSINVNY